MISIWPLYRKTRSPATAMVTGELSILTTRSRPSTRCIRTRAAAFTTSTTRSTRWRGRSATSTTTIGCSRTYGWDAIWADNTGAAGLSSGRGERRPCRHHRAGKGRVLHQRPTRWNTTGASHEGWRSMGPDDKRVYVLTRSAFAGQQRYAAGCWSGDISAPRPASWPRRFLGGLSFAISGMPYWTTDIGGYTGTPSEELFTRWFRSGLLPHLPHPRASVERRIVRFAVERPGPGQHAGCRRPTLPADALHLLARLDGDEPGVARSCVRWSSTSRTTRWSMASSDQFMFGPAPLVNPW